MQSVSMTLAAIAATLLSVSAVAQGFPSKPVHMIVPFPAGSTADTVARIVGEKLAQTWRQPVVVENRPGAGGAIGVAAVAKAAPDGYVLLAHSSSYAVSPALNANGSAAYDPNTLIDIAPVGSQPYALVVAGSAKYASVGDLVAAARAKPQALSFGSAGTGSSTHLVAEKFRLAARIEGVHVPYKGIGEANADTMTGRIEYWFPPLGLVLPLIREGKLKALAVTGTRRSEFAPEVPTLAEAGINGVDDMNWFGIWAPSRTPPDVVARIAQDVARAVAEADVRQRLMVSGTIPMSLSQADFAKFVRAEIDAAVRVVNAVGIKAE